MDFKINKSDIDEFIDNYGNEYAFETIFSELSEFYTLTNSAEKYVLRKLIEDSINKNKMKKDTIQKRKLQLKK